MSRWCNIIHQPSPNAQIPPSPTLVSGEHEAFSRPNSRYSPEELENLQKYNNFMNDLSVRVEGGWAPPDALPYNEDLLRQTLGLSSRVKTRDEFYPNSDQVYMINQSTQKFVSDKKTESDQESISINTTKRELQFTDQGTIQGGKDSF